MLCRKVLGRGFDSRRLHHIDFEKPLQIQGLSFLGVAENWVSKRFSSGGVLNNESSNG